MNTITSLEQTDIVIVGTGVAGLFCALNLPRNKKIIMITKDDTEKSDSFLAQGGICVLKSKNDYDEYFEDTLRAGHYENNRDSVDIMLQSSQQIIDDLIGYGVNFQKDSDGNLAYTREGAHTSARILYHKDITGQEIVTKLLAQVRTLSNVTILTYTTMIDIIQEKNRCYGIICKDSKDHLFAISASCTLWACGGIGGLYTNSTNFRHLTADALAISLKHNIDLENIDYIQIHPTTLYSTTPGQRFLISESVRGEGAVLLDAAGKRFINELLPRDVVSAAILKQMNQDNLPYVLLSLAPIPKETILTHFPNIYEKCLEEGIDITKEPIPVVPAQHYFMGGVAVNRHSMTSMECLYAAGETSCNGVHGANRLASNSLLESLVFAKRAAKHMMDMMLHDSHSKISLEQITAMTANVQYPDYDVLDTENKKRVLDAIENSKSRRERFPVLSGISSISTISGYSGSGQSIHHA